MAANRYRVNPKRAALDKRWGVGGYKVQTIGKGKSRRYVVKPNDPNYRPGGAGTTTDTGTTTANDDPLGIKTYLDAYNKQIDTQETAHKAWAGDVRKWTESSLQNIYNAREAAANSYKESVKLNTVSPVGQNAPVVGSSSGSATGVADQYQQQSNARSTAQVEMDKAQSAIAALNADTLKLDQSGYVAAQLQNYDYWASQLPAQYNAKKQKYAESLTSAVLDLEGKKEIAQIGADARMYGAQQQLLGALAGVQGADNRALIGALTSLQNTQSNNQTRVNVANANNQSRQQIASANREVQWARIRQQRDAAAAKGGLDLRKFHNQQWAAFWNGTPVDDGAGGKAFYFTTPMGGQGPLRPGATPAGSDLLNSKDAKQQVLGAKMWMHTATSLLGMSQDQALKMLWGKMRGNPTQKKRVLSTAGYQLRTNN